MKNRAGMIGGFVFGMVGFLVMFKLIILDNTPPSDELAPGIVVILSIMNGFLFAFIGQRIQNHFGKRATTTESE